MYNDPNAKPEEYDPQQQPYTPYPPQPQFAPPPYSQYQQRQDPPDQGYYAGMHQMPPTPPQPPKKRPPKWALFGCGGLIVLSLFVCVVAATTHGSTNTDATTYQATAVSYTPVATATLDQNVPTAPPAPTQAPAKWATTQTFKGSGNQKTAVFNVPDDWKIKWSCPKSDIAAQYGEYNLSVDVYNSDGTDMDLGAVNELCKKSNANGITEEHNSGTIYLDIQSEAGWTITVQELK